MAQGCGGQEGRERAESPEAGAEAANDACMLARRCALRRRCNVTRHSIDYVRVAQALAVSRVPSRTAGKYSAAWARWRSVSPSPSLRVSRVGWDARFGLPPVGRSARLACAGLTRRTPSQATGCTTFARMTLGGG